MKKIWILILITGMFACQNRSNPISESKTIEYKDSVLTEVKVKVESEKIVIDSLETTMIDSLETFIVDGYNVTDEMLASNSKGQSFKFKIGELYSLEKAWFKNDTLNQTLVFELYTDYHRLYTYLFSNENIPSEIIKDIGLSVAKGKYENIFESASIEQTEKHFDNFIEASENINQSYFTTIKGFKLGDSKNKAIQFYGEPDSAIVQDRVERLEWNFLGEYAFVGDFAIKTVSDAKGKLIAKDSFGHKINMYFMDNSLVAIVFENDIP